MGDVKLALLLGAMLGRTVPVALMIGMVAALVPVGRAARPARQRRPEDGDPVRRRSSPSAASSPSSAATRCSTRTCALWLDALPSRRRREPRSRLSTHRAAAADNSNEGYGLRTSTEPAHRRLARRADGAGTGAPPLARHGVNATAELVADLLVGDRSPPARQARARPRPRRRRARSRRRSSTRARLAARASRARSRSSTICRSSTSRSTGVDADAAELIPLPVLERVVRDPVRARRRDAAGSRSPSRRTSTGSTSSGSRRATRSSSPSRSREDILAELRRLARASEASHARSRWTTSTRPRRAEEDEDDDLEADDGDLGRAARPARQLDHLPGRRGRRQRHPLRAAGGRARRALPDRRRAARRCSGSRSGSPPA